MKKYLFALFLAACSEEQSQVIGITQIVEHPSLDCIRKGIVDSLKKSNPKAKIIFESAQGKPSLAVAIAGKFAARNVDLIIAISTPSAQTAKKMAKNIPVVFSAITNPQVAGLSYQKGHLTGVIIPPPAKEILTRIRKEYPAIKKLGIIVNNSEDNALFALRLMQEYAAKMDLSIVSTTINNSYEASLASAYLVNKVDGIILLQDNTVASALSSIMKIFMKNDIPVFATFSGAIEHGAQFSVDYDEYQLGQLTAELASKVLVGEFPDIAAPSKLHFQRKVMQKNVATK